MDTTVVSVGSAVGERGPLTLKPPVLRFGLCNTPAQASAKRSKRQDVKMRWGQPRER